MSKKVEFEDKIDVIDSPEVPDNQKLKADEFNAMRDGINGLADEMPTFAVNADGTVTITYDDGK